eukprot:1144424-Rhodomonas_salina.6
MPMSESVRGLGFHMSMFGPVLMSMSAFQISTVFQSPCRFCRSPCLIDCQDSGLRLWRLQDQGHARAQGRQHRSRVRLLQRRHGTSTTATRSRVLQACCATQQSGPNVACSHSAKACAMLLPAVCFQYRNCLWWYSMCCAQPRY